MFDIDEFVVSCREALSEDQPQLAIKELLERAVSAPEEVARALPPSRAEIVPLYASDDLTVLKVVWAPEMSFGPHNLGWDAYRRFIQMFGRIVLDVDGTLFEPVLEEAKQRRGVEADSELDAAALEEVANAFLELVRARAGREFPTDPLEQLDLATRAVFASWYGRRAHDYREFNKIPHDLGTAVNVVAMVFGNLGADSGTGWRSPGTRTPGRRPCTAST